MQLIEQLDMHNKLKVRLKSMRTKDETGRDWEECLEVDIRVDEEVNHSTLLAKTI